MKKITLGFFALFLLALFVLPLLHSMEIKTLVIESKPPAEFKVEVANTIPDMAKGLMNRKELVLDRGMYFDFGNEISERQMWMKDTLIPLDMLFIAPDHRIINIKHDAPPLSEEKIESGGRITGVLEINGGLADKLNIKVGDKVRFK